MDTVTATGTVRQGDDQLVLVPTGPTGPDHQMALDLRGADLPPTGTRAAVEGELDGRALQVVHWRPEPAATSAWGPIPEGFDGVSPEEAELILDSVPEDWPLVSFGESKVAGGERHVVVLEVERATAEIRQWLEQQPPGAVHLVAFINSDTD